MKNNITKKENKFELLFAICIIPNSQIVLYFLLSIIFLTISAFYTKDILSYLFFFDSINISVIFITVIIFSIVFWLITFIPKLILANRFQQFGKTESYQSDIEMIQYLQGTRNILFILFLVLNCILNLAMNGINLQAMAIKDNSINYEITTKEYDSEIKKNHIITNIDLHINAEVKISIVSPFNNKNKTEILKKSYLDGKRIQSEYNKKTLQTIKISEIISKHLSENKDITKGSEFDIVFENTPLHIKVIDILR